MLSGMTQVIGCRIRGDKRDLDADVTVRVCRGANRGETPQDERADSERTDSAPALPFPSRFSGGDLLSQGVAPAVSSAQKGLTAVFGMGTGGAPSL